MGQVLLVRHGQASFGAEDYDVLSERGLEQARATGRLLADLKPTAIVRGTLRRQQETAEELLSAAGWRAPVLVDERWNEMDHLELMARVPSGTAGEPDRHQFQQWFEAATAQWLGGEHDGEYDEPFPAFEARVVAALGDLSTSGPVVVVSSGGPISVVVAELTQGGRSAYRRLAPVVINASVTKLISGRRGLTMVSFNEHAHLAGELLTYR